MDLIKKIHNSLSGEIAEMNELIVNSLAVEEELISIIGMHLSNAGGKRIRPLLTILTAKMFGYQGDHVIKLATAVEFIHMATLLHDDVVDGSKMRRFLPTANVIWGSKASILVGDFLFSQAFKLIVATKLLATLESLSRASAIIAAGEVSQLTTLEQNVVVGEDDYYKVINAKTAELFGASCEVGAIVAGKTEAERREIRNFGIYLGNIFQITDDALDYFSESNQVGKNIGDDFFEGKITLPLILLNQHFTPSKKNRLNLIMQSSEKNTEDFRWVREEMINYNIPRLIQTQIENISVKAFYSLDQASKPEIESKKYLRELVDFAINRNY